MKSSAGRSIGAVLATAAMILWGAPAFAAGTLQVVILAPGEATVTLTAPDGTALTEVSSKGELMLRPATAGTHKLTIAVGDQTETTDIQVPDRGQGRVIYNPAGTPKIQFYVAVVEEVTVTAQRVEESMQDIPVAVTAFTANDFKARNIENVQKISESTPNLFMETNTGLSSGSRATLRGVGEDESFFTADPPVGVYIDDIYIPRQNGAQFDLFEIERLEVLRGPQGTLYGRNTSAGAIRFVTQKPGNQFRLNLEGTLGEYSQTDFRGGLNAPLGDKAAFQIAGMIRQRDGYDTDRANAYRSGGDRDVNDKDVWGIRGSLSLTPSDRVNILLVGDLLREGDTPGFSTAFKDQPPAGPTGYGTGMWDLNQDFDGDGDPHTMQSDLESWINDIDMQGFSGTITWQMNDRMTFKSVTGYRELDHRMLLDIDGRTSNYLAAVFGPGPTFHLYQDQVQNQLSQELQVQGVAGADNQISYIAGFYYFHEKNDQRSENIIFFPQGRNRFWDTYLDTDSYAGFASVTFGVGEKVDITAGARYTRDSKIFDHHVYVAGGYPYPASPTTLIACVAPDGRVVGSTRSCLPTDPAGSVNTPVVKHLEPSWDAFTPRFAIDFKANEDVLIYASASRGFKSGAFDGRTNEGSTVLILEPIPPETLWTFEAGLKSDWFQNRFRLNATAFLNKWNDLQGTGTHPSGNLIRMSLGDVETKGLEFEVKTVPAEGLELTGTLAFLDTRYTEVNFDQEVLCYLNNTGDAELEMKQSPKYSYRLGALYTTPEALGGRFSFGGSVSGKDKFYSNNCNNEGGATAAYSLVDAFLAYETSDGRWRISANGENLTDEVYVIGSLFVAGLKMGAGYLNPPRRFMVSVRFSY